MANLNRRHFIAAAGAAAAALPMVGNAFAQEKIKIGFIFLGPIGDYGWTWAHNKGREAVNSALGDKVETIYVENVAEDASAIPLIRDLAQQGCKLIFTTSYPFEGVQLSLQPWWASSGISGMGEASSARFST